VIDASASSEISEDAVGTHGGRDPELALWAGPFDGILANLQEGEWRTGWFRRRVD